MTAVALPTREITAPGIYPDITSTEYHADPYVGGSLSSTGARRLLPPSCPAKFRHATDETEKPREHFDIGSAAHDALIGGGPEIVVVAADNWRTNKAKAAAAEARLRGAVPVLTHQWEAVQAMVAAVRAHPTASIIFEPGRGIPEPSLFATDASTGVTMRARIDYLHDGPSVGGRFVIPDLKTAANGEPGHFMRRPFTDYGYHVQGAWYCEVAERLEVCADPLYLLVIVEKEPPHIVTVLKPDTIAMQVGDAMSRKARHVYAECVAADRWPGYSDDVVLGSLPPWAEIEGLDVATEYPPER